MAECNDNDLIGLLYAAALGQESWEQATSAMVGTLEGDSLILSVLDPRALSVEVVGYQGLTGGNVQEYLGLAHHDPWLACVTDRRLFNAAVRGSELVTEKELINSFMYNEFLRPRTGVHHLLGSVLTMGDGRVGIIGTHRPRGAKNFGRRNARRLDRLLPHLSRALEVRSKLDHSDRARQAAQTVLDQLHLGTIVLAVSGKPLQVNPAAEAMLRAQDGLTLTATGLRAANTEDNRRLQAQIAGFRHTSASGGSAGGHLRIRRPSGKQAYAVMLAPALPRIAAGNASPAILVFISDPDEQIVSHVSVLRDLFGFPQAEGRLVLALLSGIPLRDFAQNSGVTYNTARTLLARAMARAEARSQLDLVLRVTSAMRSAIVAPLPVRT
jgi:PAS domain-containing protein